MEPWRTRLRALLLTDGVLVPIVELLSQCGRAQVRRGAEEGMVLWGVRLQGLHDEIGRSFDGLCTDADGGRAMVLGDIGEDVAPE